MKHRHGGAHHEPKDDLLTFPNVHASSSTAILKQQRDKEKRKAPFAWQVPDTSLAHAPGANPTAPSNDKRHGSQEHPQTVSPGPTHHVPSTEWKMFLDAAKLFPVFRYPKSTIESTGRRLARLPRKPDLRQAEEWSTLLCMVSLEYHEILSAALSQKRTLFNKF